MDYNSYFLSATEYAHLKGISKMQVIRQIRSGLVSAQRVGNRWLISSASSLDSQINLTKTTSLQVWAKLVKAHLGLDLDIERSKDRELIYAQLHSLGLPHQRSFSLSPEESLTKEKFTTAVKRIGFPYWISAVPNPNYSYLDRQTKLGLYEINTGWKFIDRLPEVSKYKIIISQYPENTQFGGTLFISATGHGLAEFVTGDRHYLMTRGFTATDPLLFDSNHIVKYSSTVPSHYQDHIFQFTKNIPGHFEFCLGTIDHHTDIIFFDYSHDHHYATNIDPIWKPLLSAKSGLTASAGQASGTCLVVHHQNYDISPSTSSKYILISDTLIPEMVPLLKSAQAVVTDLGGVTSHPSIVLRELKIPTIVGTINATSQFSTGQKVKVNATLGKITLLS